MVPYRKLESITKNFLAHSFSIKKSNLHSTRENTSKRVTSGEVHLHGLVTRKESNPTPPAQITTLTGRLCNIFKMFKNWPFLSYRSDCREDRASASGDVQSAQTNNFENWYSQLPRLTLSIKVIVWKTSRQIYLLCRSKSQLAEFPHFRVVDRWSTTPKRARYSALVAFLDTRK